MPDFTGKEKEYYQKHIPVHLASFISEKNPHETAMDGRPGLGRDKVILTKRRPAIRITAFRCVIQRKILSPRYLKHARSILLLPTGIPNAGLRTGPRAHLTGTQGHIKMQVWEWNQRVSPFPIQLCLTLHLAPGPAPRILDLKTLPTKINPESSPISMSQHFTLSGC